MKRLFLHNRRKRLEKYLKKFNIELTKLLKYNEILLNESLSLDSNQSISRNLFIRTVNNINSLVLVSGSGHLRTFHIKIFKKKLRFRTFQIWLTSFFVGIGLFLSVLFNQNRSESTYDSSKLINPPKIERVCYNPYSGLAWERTQEFRYSHSRISFNTFQLRDYDMNRDFYLRQRSLTSLRAGSSEIESNDDDKRSWSDIDDSLLPEQRKNDDKLVQSLIDRSPDFESVNDDFEPRGTKSINKLLKIGYEVIEPVISDTRFWRLVSESQKSLDLTQGSFQVTQNPMILSNAAQKDYSNYPSLRGKHVDQDHRRLFAVNNNPQNPFYFADKRFTTEQQKLINELLVPSKEDQVQFSDIQNLRHDGLSENHNELPEKIRDSQAKTATRRIGPFVSVPMRRKVYEEVEFLFSPAQAAKKEYHQSRDFNLPGKKNIRDSQFARHYYNRFGQTNRANTWIWLMRSQLMQDSGDSTNPNPSFYVSEETILNDQEPVTTLLDTKSKMVHIFEKNPLYPNKRFWITSYGMGDDAYNIFVRNNMKTLGLPVSEHQAQKAPKITPSPTYGLVPPAARITNQGRIEAQKIMNNLNNDPTFVLNDEQQRLIARYQANQDYITSQSKDLSSSESNSKDEF